METTCSEIQMFVLVASITTKRMTHTRVPVTKYMWLDSRQDSGTEG